MYTQCYINKKCVKSIFCLPIIILSFQLEWCGVISIRLWLFFPLLRFILFIIDRKTIENEIESHYTSYIYSHSHQWNSLSFCSFTSTTTSLCTILFQRRWSHTDRTRASDVKIYITFLIWAPSLFGHLHTSSTTAHTKFLWCNMMKGKSVAQEIQLTRIAYKSIESKKNVEKKDLKNRSIELLSKDSSAPKNSRLQFGA